jgi:hypothetical protein
MPSRLAAKAALEGEMVDSMMVMSADHCCLGHSGMVRRTRPGISRFRVRCWRIAPE